ncbi:MAG: hypothetical protein A2284_03570 [Deltaproteobacteria bacterium RIFOXYA12_FULL_61_11]|nr:MAG: hypothetical protein A2284_03570 [Deltaproteobacteria bacterium RIFOXYA12_FULL_61_11]
MIRLAVVGYGSMGRKHVTSFTALGCELFIHDPALTRLEPGSPLTLVPTDRALPDLPVDGYVLAAPNALHAHYLHLLLPTGKPILVEKPILCDLTDPELVRDLHRAANRVLVGYNLVFRPEFEALEQILETELGQVFHARAVCSSWLPAWREVDYRRTYSAQKALGGGILLDASHELDYLRRLFGRAETVYCSAGRLGRLELDVEDSADLVIDFPGPVRANVHLDYLQPLPIRHLQLCGERAGLTWDLVGRTLTVASSTGTTPRCLDFSGHPPLTMYRREAEHFLAMITKGASPRVDATAGLEDVALVEAAKRSAALGRPLTRQDWEHD